MRERMLGPAAENQLLVLINRRSRSNWRAMLRILRKVIQRYVPGHFMSNLSDGCVKSRQAERLEKHRCMHPPKEFGDNDLYSAGTYKKIVPMELIEFTQWLSDKDGNKIDPTTIGMPADFPEDILSALQFKPVGDKTELTTIEYGWTEGQMRDMSKAGLEQCLDKLAESLK